MPQARRKKAKKTRSSQPSSGSGLGMLFAGMVIGCVLTMLFLGWKQDPEHGLGSGINQMLEKSRQDDAPSQTTIAEPEAQKPNPSYDFYTILPEIEQVIPEEQPQTNQQSEAVAKPAPKPKEANEGHYLLQAGSFSQEQEANQLKAKLALSGYESYIQRVTVDGKRYYRVRMGPFRKLEKLDKASKDLSQKGINAMRIKVSQG